MKDFWRTADELPVTLLVALAYLALAVLTGGLEPTPVALDGWGWLTPLQAADGEGWRLVTYSFLHGGIVHLGFNLWMFAQVAPSFERALGSLRFAVLYAVSAFGGGIAACLFYDVRQPVVGGSGALFGMLGALVAINMRSGRHLLSFLDFAGPRRLLSVIAVNLLIGFLLPFVSNTAHLGGLVAGFLVAFFWLWPGQAERRALWRGRLGTAALLAGLAFGSLCPAWRWDWLWRQSERESGPRQAALQRAAAMAYFGVRTADAELVARFAARELEPAAPPPQRRHR